MTGMHPEEIKAAMRIAGTSPAMLASELGISSTTVSTVIHGRAESARVKTSIAKIISKPVSTIWPSSNRPNLQRPKGSVRRGKSGTRVRA
jgi:lambda repressor-like predicted transcriptional regulator